MVVTHNRGLKRFYRRRAEVNYTVGKNRAVHVAGSAGCVERKRYGIPALFKFYYFGEFSASVCSAARIAAGTELERNKPVTRGVNFKLNRVFAAR